MWKYIDFMGIVWYININYCARMQRKYRNVKICKGSKEGANG
jgi:hypothetical protein